MSVLKLKVLSDTSKFAQGMQGATKELNNLRRSTDRVGQALNKAFAAAGIGMGIKALAGFLKDSAHAAAEDGKSKAQLALALQNTVGASQQAITATENWIQKTSNATGIVDDNLRPSLAAATRATGNLAEAQRIVTLALDISAATGKDLTSVTTALGKAYNGNTGALTKLGVNIKDTANWQNELEKSFKGSAEAAANNDPFMKISNIFDNLKETIGAELLPALSQFADYLTSPEGEKTLKQIADTFIFIARAVGNVITFVVKNIGWFVALGVAILVVKAAVGGLTLAMKAYEIATKIAKIETFALKAAIVSTGIGAVIAAVGTLAAMWMSAADAEQQYTDNAPDLTTEQLMSTYRNVNVSGNVIEFWNTALKNGAPTGINQILADSRLTQEMRDVLSANIGKHLSIDLVLGKIFEINDKGRAIRTLYMKLNPIQQAAIDAVDKLRQNLAKTGEKFRDSVGLAFGLSGKDEFSIFNVDKVIAKMRRVVQAAKGFAGNLAKLAKIPGWSQGLSDQLIAMGPAAGNIAAQALLANPTSAAEFAKLSGQLYTTGVAAQGQTMATQQATYEININKADVSAADIIKEIHAYEKKTKRKYLNN